MKKGNSRTGGKKRLTKEELSKLLEGDSFKNLKMAEEDDPVYQHGFIIGGRRLGDVINIINKEIEEGIASQHEFHDESCPGAGQKNNGEEDSPLK